MTRFVTAVLVLLSGCGAPLEPTCIEDTVKCDDRCASQCWDGEWHEVRCFSCGESAIFSGSHNQCTIRLEACVAP